MFLVGFIGAELVRRRGRALLTALGLAVGIALVVSVTALSRGVEDARQEVFRPLAGVGTDLLVSRPVDLGKGGGGLAAFATLPRSEQQALRRRTRTRSSIPQTSARPASTSRPTRSCPRRSSRSRPRSGRRCARSRRSTRSDAR